jgi:hypothetical protein
MHDAPEVHRRDSICGNETGESQTTIAWASRVSDLLREYYFIVPDAEDAHVLVVPEGNVPKQLLQ